VYILHPEADVAKEDRALKDLELRSVWILVCAVIGLHSTWQSTCIMMPN
jgi:hypothetical protein